MFDIVREVSLGEEAEAAHRLQAALIACGRVGVEVVTLGVDLAAVLGRQQRDVLEEVLFGKLMLHILRGYL